MKSLFHVLTVSAFVCTVLCGCHHDSLADRAEKEVKDYTERYCPTPMVNGQRTDSLTFSRATNTITYYYTIGGKIDDEQIFKQYRQKLTKVLRQQLKDNTQIRAYKEAGFNFHYVFHSEKSGKVLLESTFGRQQYK